MILKKHKIPIYGGQLWVCVAGSFSKAIEEIENTIDVKLEDKKEDLRQASAMTYQFYLPDGRFRVLIIIKPRSSIALISHEALHAVNWIFQHCGVKYSLTNDEPQCYLLGWVIDRVLSTRKLSEFNLKR
jgi:hypothetical protein